MESKRPFGAEHPDGLFSFRRVAPGGSVATTISVTAFQTACAAVADAVIASDRATAYQQYAVAEAINAGLEVAVADAGSSIKRREALTGLKNALDTAFPVISQQNESSRFILGRTGFGQ